MDEEVVADCGETFFNHPLLSGLNYAVKDKLSINCMNSCVGKDNKLVWGSVNYPLESAICLSAFHSGAISAVGGKFAVEI